MVIKWDRRISDKMPSFPFNIVDMFFKSIQLDDTEVIDLSLL